MWNLLGPLPIHGGKGKGGANDIYHISIKVNEVFGVPRFWLVYEVFGYHTLCHVYHVEYGDKINSKVHYLTRKQNREEEKSLTS